MNGAIYPDDGGPAFPQPAINNEGRIGYPWEMGWGGATLRDYFAAAALTGILGARNGFLVDVGVEQAPAWAYQVADGMLRERNKEVDDERA